MRKILERWKTSVKYLDMKKNAAGSYGAAAFPRCVLGGLRFLADVDVYAGGDLTEHLDGDRVVAESLDGFGELDLALVNLEALGCEAFGDVRSSDGAEEMIVLAGLASELDGHAAEEFGLLLRGVHFRGGFFRERSANALESFHVAGGGFDGQLARQKKITGVAGLYGDDVTTMAELIDVFLQNDLHVFSLCSSCEKLATW